MVIELFAFRSVRHMVNCVGFDAIGSNTTNVDGITLVCCIVTLVFGLLHSLSNLKQKMEMKTDVEILKNAYC